MVRCVYLLGVIWALTSNPALERFFVFFFLLFMGKIPSERITPAFCILFHFHLFIHVMADWSVAGPAVQSGRVVCPCSVT